MDGLSEGGGSKKYPDWFQRAYSVLEFAGPGTGADDSVNLDGVRIGLMTLPPGFQYVPHRHRASEVYVVIGGTGDWRAGSKSEVVRPVTFIYHPPHVVHSMHNVGDDPLHLIYVWWSDDAAALQEDAQLLEDPRP